MTKPKTGGANVAKKSIAAIPKKIAAKKPSIAAKERTVLTVKVKPAAKRKVASAASSSITSSTTSALSNVAGQLFSWADKLGDIAGPVASMSLALAKSQFKGPTQKAAIKTAGVLLRQAREALGMTAQEVGQAIDLKDAALLEQAETGKVGLPFEVILRLAGVLGRHDPLSFALKLTRSYNPELWAAMEALGVGKLAVQAGREREFANIYRRRDAARRLNDKEFAALLALVGTAFDMGLEFRSQLGAAKASGASTQP
jgi:transcriptional regulator with XRE-family HTH domain